MFKAIQVCPVLSVRDVGQAIEEYELYGFGLRQSFGQPAVHAILFNHHATVHLSAEGPTGKQSAWIVVDDIDRLASHLVSVVPPDRREVVQDMPHGYRELSIEDASGNVLVFAQEIIGPCTSP